MLIFSRNRIFAACILPLGLRMCLPSLPSKHNPGIGSFVKLSFFLLGMFHLRLLLPKIDLAQSL
nr:MAG TPA: hypothetical protein [Caudoviricetes sp.]